MSWTLLVAVVAALFIALLLAASRRLERARMIHALRERDEDGRQSGTETRLQQPVVYLTLCLGCGTCVAACPEDGVLELVHGQAMVVRGARCRGHTTCERECPVGAIRVTLVDAATRADVPAVSSELEAVGSPGLFLAGEVTAHTLIKTAVEQGTAVGAEIARRSELVGQQGSEVLDLVVVGAGPAGLACSLEARRHGLRFVTIDQESSLGGTVAKYPRRKLVLSEPVELPLYGPLPRKSYTKEELMDVWREIAEQSELDIRGGETFLGLERAAEGGAGPFVVHTGSGDYTARHVCLALGRRGVPRKLEVPGEELSKVSYALLDARSYRHRKVLIVGGGDSALEAAVAIAEQPGSQVTLSYRRDAFFRIAAKNEQRLRKCVDERRVTVLFESEVREIREDSVDLDVNENGVDRLVTFANDDVFVMAGGLAPIELLERSGVSFDPALRQAPETVGEQGTGLLRALAIGFVLALGTLIFATWHADYYLLSPAERAVHPKHMVLRPGMGLGLAFGVGATAMIALNLLYLVRRSPRWRFELGSLRGWMTSHVATGILAFLLAALHGGMSPGSTVGGRSFWALFVLLVTGAIGRYLYAYVPRAANGRELALAEVKARLGRLSEEWDRGQQRFRERARHEVAELVEKAQWRRSLPGRVLALLGLQIDLRRVLARLSVEGRNEGVDEEQVRETMALARRAYRTALAAAHFEDLRALASSWRFLHRWVAALLVLLVALHIFYALSYGAIFLDGGIGGGIGGGPG